MPIEECSICGAQVSLGDTAHLLVNPADEGSVTDHYVCPSCYEGEVAPLFEREEVADPP